MAKDMLGHAAKEQVTDSGATLRPHDDQVALLILCHPANHGAGFAGVLSPADFRGDRRIPQFGIQLFCQSGILRMLLSGQIEGLGQIERMDQRQLCVQLDRELFRVFRGLRRRPREIGRTKDMLDHRHDFVTVKRDTGC